MKKLTFATAIMVAALCLTLASLSAFGQAGGQERRLTYDDWYGDVKKVLSDHYTGKTVKLKLAIPATRRGLEMIDGSFARGIEDASGSNALVRAGDEVTIKSFKVRDNDIELLLNKPAEKSKGWFFPKKPRISIRFSYELGAKDLTIENINRWLSPTMDIAALAPAGAETAPTQASIALSVVAAPPSAESGPKAPAAKISMENPLELPTSSVVGDLSSGDKNVAELTVECQTRRARIYIDDAYSGFAPRTIRLRAGAHSIQVMADGHPTWEQKLFIPGGKASLVKAELQR